MMVCAESAVEFVAAQAATGGGVGCAGSTVECATTLTRGAMFSTPPCLDLHDLPAHHDIVSRTAACQSEASAIQAYRPKPTSRKLVSRVLEADDDLDDLPFPLEGAAGKQGWSEEDPTGAQAESNAAEGEDTTEGLQKEPRPAERMAQRKEKRPRDANLQLQKKRPRKEANGCIGDLLRYVADYRVVKGRVDKYDQDLFKGPVGPPQKCIKGAPELPVLTSKDIKCNVCGTREPGRKDLLQCRECSFAQHLSCKHRGSYVLPDEVPKEPWYCHECRPQPFVGKIWIALNDLDANNSVLCVQPGSHKARNLETDYRKEGLVPTTWFTDFKGEDWHASTFKAGDVVLLNMKTVEAASRNHSGEFRMSLDTRFMLKPLRRNWGKTWRSRFADWAAGDRVHHHDEGLGVEEDGGAGGASR